MLTKSDPERAKALLAEAQRTVRARFDIYRQLADLTCNSGKES